MEGPVELGPDVGRVLADVGPEAVLGNMEAVLVRTGRQLFIVFILRQAVLVLLLPDVRDPLKEEQAEDVGLVVRGVDLPTKDVGGPPEVGFEFLETEIGHGVFTLVTHCLPAGRGLHHPPAGYYL